VQVAKPYFPAEDIADITAAVGSILESGMLMQGPHVRRFEEEVAAYVGVRYARAVNSGTSALHGLLSYYDRRDRWVIVPVTPSSPAPTRSSSPAGARSSRTSTPTRCSSISRISRGA